MRACFQSVRRSRTRGRLPGAAALGLAGTLALLAAPRPAGADHVHEGRLLHAGAARTRILVREAGHPFHRHRAREGHRSFWFHGGHPTSPHHHPHHPGHGHRVHGWGHGPHHPDAVVVPGFFCNRCRVHFDHPRAFRHHAWHHHGIRLHHLRRLGVHVGGVTILF